jgi:hypothetical protein
MFFDGNGDLFVNAYAQGNGIISRLSPSELSTSNAAFTPSIQISVPGSDGIALGTGGDLWVADWDHNRVLKFGASDLHASGAPTPTIVLSNISGPEGIAFDRRGNLWAAGYSDNKIFGYAAGDLTTSGDKTPMTTLTGGGALNTPFMIRFSPQLNGPVIEEPPPTPGGPCVGMTLAVSPSDPAIDVTAALSGSATCSGGAEAEYQFAYQAPGTTAYTLIRGWGSVASVNWSTVGLPSGAYTLYGYARRKGSNGSYDSQASSSYLVGKVCHSGASFGISPSGVRPVGTISSLSASAACTLSGTPEARFMYQLPGSSSWVDIGGWSTTPVSWDTTGLPSGSYTLLAFVRAVGNASNRESYAYGAALVGNVCYSTNLVAASPLNPQLGATVTLSATATCVGASTPEFLYYYLPPNGSAAVRIGSWSTAPVSWDTTGLPAGKYGLLAYSRAVSNASTSGESYVYANSPLNLGSLCPSVTMSASPPAIQPIGSSITVTGSAGCSPAEYQFWYRLWGNATWTNYRDWSTSPASVWDTTGLPSGLYELLAKARFEGHTGSEATTQISYAIGNVCMGAALSPSPPSPQPVGSTVTLTASATCTGGASAEYRFYSRASGSTTATLIRDWGPSTFSWWTTSVAPGSYSIYVHARGIGNTDAYDSAGERSLVLQ